MSCKSRDAFGTAAALRAEGWHTSDPIEFSRPVRLEDGSEQPATFRVMAIDDAPGARYFACEHRTPELLWRPEWMAHANGARAIGAMLHSGGACAGRGDRAGLCRTDRRGADGAQRACVQPGHLRRDAGDQHAAGTGLRDRYGACPALRAGLRGDPPAYRRPGCRACPVARTGVQAAELGPHEAWCRPARPAGWRCCSNRPPEPAPRRLRRRAYAPLWCTPVEPNPPLPRSVSAEVSTVEDRAQYRHEHHLGDALARLDHDRLGAGGIAVPHADHDLALVVGIDHADRLPAKALLMAQTRARHDGGSHVGLPMCTAKPAGTSTAGVPASIASGASRQACRSMAAAISLCVGRQAPFVQTSVNTLISTGGFSSAVMAENR